MYECVCQMMCECVCEISYVCMYEIFVWVCLRVYVCEHVCVCVCASMCVYENMCVSVEARGTVHFMFLLGKLFGGLELAKQGRPPG